MKKTLILKRFPCPHAPWSTLSAHSLMFFDIQKNEIRWHSPTIQIHQLPSSIFCFTLFIWFKLDVNAKQLILEKKIMGHDLLLGGHDRWQRSESYCSSISSWKIMQSSKVFKSFPVFISGDMLKFWYSVRFAVSSSWCIGGVLEGAVPVPDGMGRSSWKDFMLGVSAVSLNWTCFCCNLHIELDAFPLKTPNRWCSNQHPEQSWTQHWSIDAMKTKANHVPLTIWDKHKLLEVPGLQPVCWVLNCVLSNFAPEAVKKRCKDAALLTSRIQKPKNRTSRSAFCVRLPRLQGSDGSGLCGLWSGLLFREVTLDRKHPKAMSRQKDTKSPGVGYQFSHKTEWNRESKGLIYSKLFKSL